MTICLKVKKMHPDAVLPKYATAGAAGMDLTAIDVAVEDITQGRVLGEGFTERLIQRKYTFDTGLAFEIPPGHVGYIFPRSSIHKYDMTLTNCVGVIDEDYRGAVKFVFKTNMYGDPYKKGDRVGQLIVMPRPFVSVEEVDDLSDTARGDAGFGSTGR